MQVKKKPEKRITGSDYSAWDKFDVNKACEEVDMADIGPVSLDSKKSQAVKAERLKEEAQYEKERGNNFVKQEKWDEAISCYNRAIELVKDDAIYYANRGLCYLKKDSLHQAETDCTEALRLDPTYVKALQRRATARERLGSLRAASHDLTEVLKIEPHNAAARRQLEAIKARMGTKGAKSKSSPSSTPTVESKPITPPKSKIVELPSEPAKKELTPLEKWRNGVGENITVIRPVKKPPHLRSKRALKHITIHEIQLGASKRDEKPPTHVKTANTNDNAHGDTNNNNANDNIVEATPKDGDRVKDSNAGDNIKIANANNTVQNMVAPVNSVQFMSQWKFLKGNDEARSDYLRLIEPTKLPSIFENALESDVLSDVLYIICINKDKFRNKISAYLKNLCKVKRFSALAMFLTVSDKELLMDMLSHCKKTENLTDSEISDLTNKYEL